MDNQIRYLLLPAGFRFSTKEPGLEGISVLVRGDGSSDPDPDVPLTAEEIKAKIAAYEERPVRSATR